MIVLIMAMAPIAPPGILAKVKKIYRFSRSAGLLLLAVLFFFLSFLAGKPLTPEFFIPDHWQWGNACFKKDSLITPPLVLQGTDLGKELSFEAVWQGEEPKQILWQAVWPASEIEPRLSRKISAILAKRFPVSKTLILPDQSQIQEVWQDPGVFPPQSLLDGGLYWVKIGPDSFLSWMKKEQKLYLSPDPNLLFYLSLSQKLEICE